MNLSVQWMQPTHREGQTLALTCHYEAIIVMMMVILMLMVLVMMTMIMMMLTEEIMN